MPVSLRQQPVGCQSLAVVSYTAPFSLTLDSSARQTTTNLTPTRPQHRISTLALILLYIRHIYRPATSSFHGFNSPVTAYILVTLAVIGSSFGRLAYKYMVQCRYRSGRALCSGQSLLLTFQISLLGLRDGLAIVPLGIHLASLASIRLFLFQCSFALHLQHLLFDKRTLP